MTRRKALGKGLSALIPPHQSEEDAKSPFVLCPVDSIHPNPNQPRKNFPHSEFEELVASVREKGILTPLLVTSVKDGYQLIAGERRWRAARQAGLDMVPAVVRESTAAEALELALIENIHRQDLNPIEEAQAYRQCLEAGDLTQESLAKRLGKDRSTITNVLRLLSLPDFIQADLVEDNISMGHARVLAGIKNTRDQKRLRDAIVQGALTVRQAEALARKPTKGPPKKSPKSEFDEYLQSLSENLKTSLGTKVDIRRRGRRGTISIHFYSTEELDRLIEILGA